MRRLLAALTVPVLVLVACGDDSDDTEASESAEGETPEFCGDDTLADGSEPPETSEPPEVELPEPAEDDPALDVVTATGDVGEEPTVEVSGPVELDEGTVRRVVVEGDGEPVTEGTVAIHMAAFNGRTGDQLQGMSTYGSIPQPAPLEQLVMQPPILRSVLEAPVGSRVVAAFPPEEIFPDSDQEQAGSIQGLEEGDTMLWVMDLIPTRAMGTEVAPEEGLPTVTLEDNGAPSIEIPEADAPTELVSQTLIEGEGPEITEGQQFLAQYTGVCWEDGGEFDSSWSDTPTGHPSPQPFSLGAVIEGWNEGIPGHTVGSQVLLVVPSEMGYGSEGVANIPPDRTLVFVVDILAAGDPMTDGAAPTPEEGGEAPPG